MNKYKNMEYRLNKESVLREISAWDSFLKRRVSLVACGGTALTLLGVKNSTKDVDFMVPIENEHSYLIRILEDLGYKMVSGNGWSRGSNYIFDLYKGNQIHTTTLIESPLEHNNHTLLKEFSHIYLGILNSYDIIISKLFRGAGVDFDDCFLLVETKKKEIDLDLLQKRFYETSSYDISEKKVNKNLVSFLKMLKKHRSKK